MFFDVHPLRRLCRGRFRRGRLFARQVRHPDRTAAAGKTGRRQRLDRRPDRDVDHPRHRAGRRAGQRHGSRLMLGFDFPLIDTGIDTTAEAAHGVVAFIYVLATAVQPAHPRHRRALRAPGAQSDQAGRRLRQLLDHALERQAGPDFAGRHHPVLGRRRDLAVHRAEVGREARSDMPLDKATILIGRGRHRRGARRGAGGAHRPAAQIADRDPAGHRHGPGRDRAWCSCTIVIIAYPLLVADRLPVGLFRGADERAAAAPRPRADERRPLDRGAELQREPVDPDHAGAVRHHDHAEPRPQHHHRAVRPVGRRHHVPHHAPACGATSASTIRWR